MKKPFRIASLCPSNTELIDALGLIPNLVGVDNYSDYPQKQLSRLPRLGPDLHINMEKLLSLQPDLTLASLSVPGMERVVEQLKNTGLKYIVLSPHRLDEIFDDMRTVAKHCQDFAPIDDIEQKIKGYEKQVSTIRQATKSCAYKPKLYFEWWANPIFSPARRNWLTEISELAGAENLFADIDDDKYKGDWTEVLRRNPDYFFAVWTGIPQSKVPVQKIKQRPGWLGRQAFAADRLFILSEGLYCRPSVRLIDGLLQLVSLIHPDIANSLGLERPEKYGRVRTWNGEWLGGEMTPANN